MAERKPFLLRVDREVLDAVQRWANDDLRSLNAQIEFLLRRALRAEGRLDRLRGDGSRRGPGGSGG
ncbi:MAG TPA: Arc family DNA-binding protein [Vicinamibacteria bacterium]|nr:Arc family DNA-binding protein [Vicinamibacteria bacterium]